MHYCSSNTDHFSSLFLFTFFTLNNISIIIPKT
ncbi:unnamed protein product [Schistosoma mattheei]|uniref:Uncharacterized protein n=1 Tax=Schistosoma mattheei TaxID=31246 RepID=A0A3P8K071_9TREM|nr:unnamed protein product [Schistosoma mattheei]